MTLDVKNGWKTYTLNHNGKSFTNDVGVVDFTKQAEDVDVYANESISHKSAGWLNLAYQNKR